MASKDPAFLFYSSDFLTGTTLMSDEQIGKYIRLLCLQHQKGRLSEKDMLKICYSYDEDIFSKFSRDDAGLYFNKRLEDEMLKRSKYSESRRNNRLNSKKNKKDMNDISKTYVKHMENENINENINISIDNVKGGVGEKFQDQEINWRKMPQNHKTQFGIVFSDLEPLEYIKKHYPNFYTTQVMNARISEDKLSLFNEQARYVSYQNEFHFQSSFKKFIKDHGKHQNNTNRAGATAAIRSGHIKDFNA